VVYSNIALSRGRTPRVRAGADAFSLGRYVIDFDLTDYFKGIDKTLPANFFRKVSVEFEVTDKEMPLHIPLQCTPWTQACSVLPGG
jgi:5-hydroxyisourate hydrolase-like protein (transthyretin family)